MQLPLLFFQTGIHRLVVPLLQKPFFGTGIGGLVVLSRDSLLVLKQRMLLLMRQQQIHKRPVKLLRSQKVILEN